MSVKCWASVAGAGQYPFSPSEYFMLVGTRAHSAWRAAADSEMEVSAYFTSAHILSLGRAVAGNAADSEIEVSAYFTSVHITVFWKGCDRHCCRQWNGRICWFHKCAYTVCWKGCDSEHIRPLGNTVTRRTDGQNWMGHTDEENAQTALSVHR